jgi:hypothetical protein
MLNNMLNNMLNKVENIENDQYLLQIIKKEEDIIKKLIKQDKIYIKRFIYENFIKKGYNNDILTDNFLNFEMYYCIRNYNRYHFIPNLPYINGLYLPLYLPEYRVKIYDIIKYSPGLHYL